MAIHRFVLHNGTVRKNTEGLLAPGQLGLLAGWGVFSTLRMLGGRIFAWERHWARMVRDAKLMNVPMPAEADRVEADLLKLAEANGMADCTIRVVVVRNGGGMWAGPGVAEGNAIGGHGKVCDVIAMTADFKAWGESVRLDVQPHARYAASDFTRAKILSWSGNLTWAEKAQAAGFDEVLLLNEHGRVAECTSANVFGVFGREVVTPALGEGCLPGITREILLELGGVREATLTVEELCGADEVFITSTTRDLLPVREIDGHLLRFGGDVRAGLAAKFAAYLAADIARRKELAVR